MPAPPTVPPFRLGVFTGAEARADGWTRSSLAAAVRRGALDHIRRGCWAPALDPADPGTRALTLARTAVAASLATPGSAVSHLSAATAWGVPTWAPDARACVTESGRRHADLDGVHRHRATGDGVGRHGGVLITDPARTVFDVTREYGPQSGLVVADAALRAKLVDTAALDRAAAACRGWPGARTARLVAAMADPLAESPLESRSRWQFHRHDIPAPRPQTSIYTLSGVFVARVDFWWDDGVVGEVDGDVKYTDPTRPDALSKEKWRQEALERLRIRVARWGVRDFGPFDRVADELRTKLRRARTDPEPRLWIARPAETTHVPPAW